jgi:hypothetical protein
MRALNPNYLTLVKQLQKACRKLPRLHFTDLSEAQKIAVGKRLAKANVTVFSAHYWYVSTTMSHGGRFSIYKDLVKMVINSAFKMHDDVQFGIGKQGGWQKYEREFLAELKRIPKEFNSNGNYRKGEFALLSAAKPGIQLADFYVGTVRDYHLGFLMPHEYIKQQILCYQIYDNQVSEQKKEE